MEECTMDEVNPDKLNNLLTDTHAYIRRNNYKFEQAAAELMRKRSLTQKVVDYVTYKSQLMGVVQSNWHEANQQDDSCWFKKKKW